MGQQSKWNNVLSVSFFRIPGTASLVTGDKITATPSSMLTYSELTLTGLIIARTCPVTNNDSRIRFTFYNL